MAVSKKALEERGYELAAGALGTLLKKSAVKNPEARLTAGAVPNMFYRDDLENTILAEIRREREPQILNGPITTSVRAIG